MKSDVDINRLEVHYRQEDKEGWGAGGYEYINAQDITAISCGFHSVMESNTESIDYTCQEGLFKIHLFFRQAELTWIITLSMLKTLERNYYIDVSNNHAAPDEIKAYMEVFDQWAHAFPVLKEYTNRVFCSVMRVTQQRELHLNYLWSDLVWHMLDVLLENNDPRLYPALQKISAILIPFADGEATEAKLRHLANELEMETKG